MITPCHQDTFIHPAMAMTILFQTDTLTNQVFNKQPSIIQLYPYCSPYPPPCNVYPTQYSNVSQLSSQSNSGTNHVINNTCNTHMMLSLDFRLEDPPVFRLLQLNEINRRGAKHICLQKSTMSMQITPS